METLTIRIPSIEEVEFAVSANEEAVSVRGNALASGDDKIDKKVEDGILRRLENGKIWAWASVTVTASWRGMQGEDHLGCCSYKSEKEFKRDGYYSDMKAEAYNDLVRQIKRLAE